MTDGDNVSLLQNLRWYLGTDEVDRDAAMVTAGGPLALLGRADDDVVAFADRLAPERPVLDLLDGQRPTAPELKRLFAAHPDTVILAPRIGEVVDRIGLIVQPWYVAVTPLSRRADQAIALLRAAILDLGVTAPLRASVRARSMASRRTTGRMGFASCVRSRGDSRRCSRRAASVRRPARCR